MIPFTFPSVGDHGQRQCVVYPITSTTGLQAWIDYIPVKQVTGYTKNSYGPNGSQYVTELSDISLFLQMLMLTE